MATEETVKPAKEQLAPVKAAAKSQPVVAKEVVKEPVKESPKVIVKEEKQPEIVKVQPALAKVVEKEVLLAAHAVKQDAGRRRWLLGLGSR